ncbi:hypothetical protein DCO58_09975 [Helicobacter saguini]|uniref:Uncharacterized protein n=1 Tax=Helicobacter saguini TaxID=1548018 RepID=A0A6B0HWX2_9HELI|nr:hypothetical protein [Helicobacter saguini]MWV61367.1 hypothetical protein [Helicobacter saguini]MWV67964.1 hypothetical protein [Helicobacter saguini]MWV70569.1 hypothetical protein [Helicobacter saguini]MWV72472.1 hypothetical protein [Helicobacter saguini]
MNYLTDSTNLENLDSKNIESKVQDSTINKIDSINKAQIINSNHSLISFKKKFKI